MRQDYWAEFLQVISSNNRCYNDLLANDGRHLEGCWKRFKNIQQFERSGFQKDEDAAFSFLSDLVGSQRNGMWTSITLDQEYATLGVSRLKRKKFVECILAN